MEPMIVALLAIGGLLIANLVTVLILFLRPRSEGQQNMTPLQTQLQGLDSKLSESMQTLRDAVSDQLIQVTKGVTETNVSTRQVLTIAEQLRTLDQVLRHQKQRGNLGEQSLELILNNVLGGDPKTFQMQYQFPGGDAVDAVIFAKEGKIPIDAKFPLDNYLRILDETDEVRRSEWENAFRRDLKMQIDETARYVRPEAGTVPFAFMFIPAEGIFYDLLVNDGPVKVNARSLIDYAYNEKRVVIVSPTTFAAYLQSVLYGFKAFKVEEGAREIAKNVETLSQRLKDYEERFRRVGNSLSATVNHYNTAYKEFARIDRDVLRITGERMGIEPVALDRPLAAE